MRIASTRVWRRAGVWLAGCCVVPSAVVGALAQDGDRTLTDANPTLEVMMRSGPLEWMIRRFYRDSPDCVSAKLDVWFRNGRYSHQVFTARSDPNGELTSRMPPGRQAPISQEMWEGDRKNPAMRQVIDADTTTIFVGHEGCRYRVRIERAD